MAKINLSGKLVANGYSRSTSQGAKSAGKAAPKTPGSIGSAASMQHATGVGSKANAKKIITKPSQSLNGMSVSTGKMGGYTKY